MDKKKQSISGRKRLKVEEKRRRIYLYLNDTEIEELKLRVKDAGHRYISEYIRHNLIVENYKPRHLNPVKFMREVSNLARAVDKLGNNINQIAKYCNELKSAGLLQPQVIEAYEEKLTEYIWLQHDIIKKVREVIRTRP